MAIPEFMVRIRLELGQEHWDKWHPQPGQYARVSTWPRGEWGRIAKVEQPTPTTEGSLILWGPMRSVKQSKKISVSLADISEVVRDVPRDATAVYHDYGKSYVGVARTGTRKTAKADLTPVRQRTQYSCMAASMAMALNSLGHKVTEDEVNNVMGARPMKGASWESALACAQHYGCRATLTVPATVKQLKGWTDAGTPVMIAWNPEGRPWSHASVVFDVDDELNVHVADPNIPDPDETVRVVPKSEFYGKWYEKWPDYLVRRPACAIEREVTPEGRQVMAKKKTEPVPPPKKDKNKIEIPAPTQRSEAQREWVEQRARGTGGAGAHKDREQDVEKGRSRKEKHKKDLREKEASIQRVADLYLAKLEAE